MLTGRNSHTSPSTPRISSTKDLLKKAKEAYAQKQYDTVLKLLPDPFSGHVQHTLHKIEILEARSSAHFKSGRPDLALRDAKFMIRTDRTDARGYIRCSQIQRSLFKWDDAIAFLTHGLRVVPQTNTLYQQFEKRIVGIKADRDECLRLQKRTDPLAVLPPELLQMILSHLSYRDVTRSSRVCRAWRGHLMACSPLSDTIDFRDHGRKRVSSTAVRRLLERPRRQIRTVTLVHLSEGACGALIQDLRNWVKWSNLEHLYADESCLNKTLPGLRFGDFRLKTVETGSELGVSWHTVTVIMNSCPHLRRAAFKCLYRTQMTRPQPEDSSSAEMHTRAWTGHQLLEELELFGRSNSSSSNPAILFSGFSAAKFPRLRRLHCENIKTDTFDVHEFNQLTDVSLPDVPSGNVKLPSTLLCLRLRETELPGLDAMRSPSASIGTFEQLHTLRLCGAEADTCLVRLLEMGCFTASQLTNLHLTSTAVSGRLALGELVADAQKWPSNTLDCLQTVRNFELCTPDLKDNHAELYGGLFPEVVTLDISSPYITGAFIGHLLRRPGNKIRKVTLRNCHNISLDTVHWAKARGVDARFVNSKQVGGVSHIPRSQFL